MTVLTSTRRAMPATAMTGPLQWTRDGVVWALWRVCDPVRYGSRPAKDKEIVRALHQALLRALDGEALLLGVMARIDPVTVVESMLEGIDLSAHRQWALECDATLDQLDDIALGERTYWIAVPLANTGGDRFGEPLRAAQTAIKDAFGMPRGRPDQDLIDRRLQQVQEMTSLIPSVLGARPATVAEQVWVAASAQRRGLVDLEAPPADPATAATDPHLASGCAVPEAILDEGGTSDLRTRRAARLNPLARVFLKVTDLNVADFAGSELAELAADVDVEEEAPASYQVLMAISDMPPAGMRFPGSEYLSALDRCGVDVDWAVRLTIRNRDDALRKTRRALRNLNDQYDQREGSMTTGHHELDLAGELLTEYQATLAQDKREVEVQHTTILAVGAATPTAAKACAQAAARVLTDVDITVERPLGGQEELWWQMLPGVATSRITRRLTQFTTAANYACVVPLTTSALGDRTGIPLALTRSTTRPRVVLHHLDGHARRGVNPSVAVCAENGAGKTYTLLRLAGAVADRGGQLLVIDRSAEREYARFVTSLDDHIVVDVERPEWSMDPLRALPRAAASRVAHSFITVLTGITNRSGEGVAVSQVLDPAYLTAHRLTSMADVVDHLVDPACLIPGAAGVGQRLRNFAGMPLGAVVFDPDLPPMPLTHNIVWGTYAVELPTAEELRNQHLFDQLRVEKLFGRAYYALIPDLCRSISEANPDRFTFLVCDEAHAINSSPESSLAVTRFIREGRRADAAVGLGSHDAASDFGDDTQRGLIRTRILLRHTDDTLARRGLEFAGFDPADPEFDALVDTLMHDTSPMDSGTGLVAPERRGEGWMRDITGAIEPIRILPQPRAERAAAADTTPGAHHVRPRQAQLATTAAAQPHDAPDDDATPTPSAVARQLQGAAPLEVPIPPEAASVAAAPAWSQATGHRRFELVDQSGVDDPGQDPNPSTTTSSSEAVAAPATTSTRKVAAPVKTVTAKTPSSRASSSRATAARTTTAKTTTAKTTPARPTGSRARTVRAATEES